jgi:flagellar biosynthetic protein FliR
MNLFEFRIEQIQLFILLVTRCSGIFIFTPFLGNFNVPAAVRVMLSVALGYFLFLSSGNIHLPVGFSMGTVGVGMLEELLIGLVIGFAANALFAGLQLSGHYMGFQMGLSFVNSIDPSTSNRSMTVSVYQNFLGLMLFMGFNGHHWFIEAIAKSISIIPPYSLHLQPGFLAKTIELTSKIFVIGFQVSAPLVVVMLLVDVALGIIGRTAPQVHILVIGFPIKVLVGLMCMGLGLYFLPVLMRNSSFQLYRDIYSLLHLMVK